MSNLTFISNIKAVSKELPEEDKTPKEIVSYTPHSPMYSQECQGCQHFISPNRCETVKGIINIEGWCIRFERDHY